MEENDSLLHELINISRYSEIDLDENRLGLLSPLQKMHLTILAIVHTITTIICLSTFLFTLYLISIYGKDISIIVCAIWGALFLISGIRGIINSIPFIKDIYIGKVENVSGDVNLIFTQIHSRGMYGRGFIYYKIAGILFDRVWVASEILPKGKNCKVYYTKESKIIVGVEPK
jgi:hypothetical protein